jgi:hypothetical protein
MLDVARADYFMLTIQHGEDRRSAPVDVFLWDLQRREPLLRARVQARGTFLPARIAIGDAPTAAAQRLPERAGLVDCSIASLVREVAGRPAASVTSEMPPPPSAEPAAVPEGEGGPPTDDAPNQASSPSGAPTEGASPNEAPSSPD